MRDARELVADALTASLVDVVVVDYPRQADQPDARRVTVAPLRVDPPSVACPVRSYVVTLTVVTPYTEPGVADDDLDDLLELVLIALDQAGMSWDQADRGLWLDTHHAYAVNVALTL